MRDRLALARATLEEAEYKAGLRLVRALPSRVRDSAGEDAHNDVSGLPISGALIEDAYTVPEWLAPVFPRGISRHAPVEVSGSSALPLLLSGIASRQGAWVAIVGTGNISWAMADHSGVDRARLAYVPEVNEQVAQVIGAAVDGFDVVVLGAGVRLDRREKRVLDRRARSKNTLLIANKWESARVRVWCQLVSIDGISAGRGHIAGMSYEVSSRSGRAVLNYGHDGWTERKALLSSWAWPVKDESEVSRISAAPGRRLA